MTLQPLDYQPLLERRARLFTPRPGWMFRDRWSHLSPFTERPPIAQRVPPHQARRMRPALPLSAAAFVVLVLFGGCAATDQALSGPHAPLIALVLALVCAAPGGAVTRLALLRRRPARAALERARSEAARAYEAAVQARRRDADTSQRVYEYAVEPVVLQHLPDHALLLVESEPGGGRKLSAVDPGPPPRGGPPPLFGRPDE